MTAVSIWQLLIHRRKLTLLLFLSLCCLLSAGAAKLTFRGDYRTFFKPDNPQLLAYERMQKQFNKNDNLLIGIAPQQGDIFTPQHLKLLHQLTEELWQTPYSIRVDSLSNFQHTEGRQDELIVASLIDDPQQLTPAAISRVRQISLQEPLLLRRLISEDATVAAVNISLQFPDAIADAHIRQSYLHVEAVLQKYRQLYPQVSFYQTGVVAMNYSFSLEAEQDSMRLIPVMFLTIILMLIWLLRSSTAALATVVVIVSTIAITMGFAGWAGFFISVTTVNVPIFIMTLAVSDSVHLVSAMQHAQRQGMAKEQAVQHALEHNFSPVIITSVTTAIGFLTLNFSEVPILQDLGNLTAVGVMIACVLSLTILPVLLLLLPAPLQNAKADHKSMLLLAAMVTRWRGGLLWFGLVVTLLCGVAVSFNKVNDEPLKYFSPATQFRQANDFMEQHMSPAMSIDIMLESGKASGINDAAYLAALQDFSQWLATQPEVTHVVSLTDIYKRLNKNMNGDLPQFYQLPQQQQLAAQYLLLYEMSLPFGLDLNNLVDIDKSAGKTSATIRNLGSKELVALEQRIAQYLQQHQPYAFTISGAALMFAHISEQNMQSMLWTLPLTLVLISLLLVVIFRSWRIGFFSFLSNLVPAVIGFGVWGLYKGEINLGLSVVAGISLGIIVDDTVHFLCNYQKVRAQGASTFQAVHYTLSKVGRALWSTSVVLIAGFGVLIFSGFRLNADMGLLTALIIFFALVVCMILFPAFLLCYDGRKEAKTGTEPQNFDLAASEENNISPPQRG